VENVSEYCALTVNDKNKKSAGSRCFAIWLPFVGKNKKRANALQHLARNQDLKWNQAKNAKRVSLSSMRREKTRIKQDKYTLTIAKKSNKKILQIAA
jgi:hypothetical protein